MNGEEVAHHLRLGRFLPNSTFVHLRSSTQLNGTAWYGTARALRELLCKPEREMGNKLIEASQKE